MGFPSTAAKPSFLRCSFDPPRLQTRKSSSPPSVDQLSQSPSRWENKQTRWNAGTCIHNLNNLWGCLVLTLLNMCISKQSIEIWLRAAAQQHSLGCGLESNPEPWPLTHFRGLQNAGLLVAHRTLYRFWSKGARSENSAKQKKRADRFEILRIKGPLSCWFDIKMGMGQNPGT